MALENKYNSQPTFTTSNDDLPVVSQLLAGRALPGKHVDWRPSETEHYKLYIQLLGETERLLCDKRARARLEEQGIKKDTLPDYKYEELYAIEVAKQVVQLSVREGEIKTYLDPKTQQEVSMARRLVFPSIKYMEDHLTADRIMQLFRFYNHLAELDSPSWHYLSTLTNLDELCKSLEENKDGEGQLFLGSMPSPALAELTIGLVRYLMTHSQPLDSASSFKFPLQNSESPTSNFTKPASESFNADKAIDLITPEQALKLAQSMRKSDDS